MIDRNCIQLAIQLAAQGAALVSPNPLVGSVVVKDGVIVGRGYHRYDDLKHAEVWALEAAGANARGATVYVNLEPCSHQGAGKRTPPCSRALIDAGVKRVVASMLDPNPRVDGRGFELLREAGIDVEIGLMEREARRLNEKYIKFITTGLPFVHLKMALSLDGRIATRTGESKWITGDDARAASQMLRHEYDAILVGVNTVLADNPALTDRTQLPRRRPLVRVMLDSKLRVPFESQLVMSAGEWPLLVFTIYPEVDQNPDQTDQLLSHFAEHMTLENYDAEVVTVPSCNGRPDLKAVLAELGKRQLTSLLVEGGAEVAGSFIEQRLVDKVSFFIAPKIIGGREAISGIGGSGFAKLSDALELDEVEVTRRGDDWEFTGYPKLK
jgi:diaminohydroxyphosphoribosylaminopyrimidine deaminase / 5-amino-6-(5-phosphoribosylamino)uracil reductase